MQALQRVTNNPILHYLCITKKHNTQSAYQYFWYAEPFLFYIFAKSVNWEENRELGVVRLHIFNSRISNSRKIPGPKKRELGGHTVFENIFLIFFVFRFLKFLKLFLDILTRQYFSFSMFTLVKVVDKSFFFKKREMLSYYITHNIFRILF